MEGEAGYGMDGGREGKRARKSRIENQAEGEEGGKL